jgi:hypothetical protein
MEFVLSVFESSFRKAVFTHREKNPPIWLASNCKKWFACCHHSTYCQIKIFTDSKKAKLASEPLILRIHNKFRSPTSRNDIVYNAFNGK